METHGKVIGILFLAFGALGVLGTLAFGALFAVSVNRAYAAQERALEARQKDDERRQEEQARFGGRTPGPEEEKELEARRAETERKRAEVKSRMGQMQSGMNLVFAVLGGIVILLALGEILVGIGLLRRKSWARTAAIVLAFPLLLGIPLGTALGVYVLVLFFKPEAVEYFSV